MTKVAIPQTQNELLNLFERAVLGEKILITPENGPAIELVVHPKRTAKQPRKLGGLEHLLIEMADDFNDPLDDFAEYMA